ncbi:MAG: magnesium/cobalt transporter CorA [Deltaproteobacteria bacterium]|nr:magnesium/cobalt transporter CorA [Deltaproteobacteria bacterium]
MANKKSSRSKKAGLPPGSLVYVGEGQRHETIVSYCSFNEHSIERKELSSLDEACVAPKEGDVLWLDINGLQNIEVVEKIGKFFNLHSLVLEDILNTTKRPKFEDFGDYLFVILKVVHPISDGGRFVAEQVSIVLGKNFVLSFQEIDRHDAFASVRERLNSGRGRLRRMAADYLAYALLDSVVDGYFDALEVLGENLEQLEHEAITSASEETLTEIHHAKRQTLQFRRAVWPLREIMSGIIREECDLIAKSTMVYLRDVYDHVVEVIDVLEADRDIAAGLLEIYLSGISNRLNAVMKVLTVITTIFMPLTFIAGVYGMNFEYMPELTWRYGYPMVMAIMAVIGIGMALFFRRRHWL